MRSSQYIFLRHGKLTLPYKDHSEMPFSVFADLGTGILNPPIDTSPSTDDRIDAIQDAIDLTEVGMIASSPAERSQETAQLLASRAAASGNLQLIRETTDLLAEVRFDLRALNTSGNIEHALEQHDIQTVNDAIFQGMLSGEHCESIERAYERVQKLFEYLKTSEMPCISITHDFLMRVIEIYIKRGGAAYAPISLSDLQNTHRNVYLSGFATDESLSNFSKI
jgi:broad specificity phosphatase PhoE